MKRKNEDEETVLSREAQDDEDESTEEEVKKEKRKAGAERRRGAKKRDKVARWGGLILFGLMLFVGFLLWVAGEMQQEASSTRVPTTQSSSGSVRTGGSVIVK